MNGASESESEDCSVASSRASERNRKKKEKKKANKAAAKAAAATAKPADGESGAPAIEEGVEVEYVSVREDLALTPALAELAAVFGKFNTAEELTGIAVNDGDEGEKKDKGAEEEAKPAEEEEEPKLSKKQKKKLKRLSIAELKQLVAKPEVVEQWDVTAADPRLLVHLKSYRNSIPVPKHWCQKRKFLMGKRGVEKPPFQLPDFIAATGIEKIRASVMEKENAKKLKSKQKERMQPKMGKIDIDYQVLHDAFFKYQTKPRLTRHGDVYYEGKEFEVSLREKRPGVLSDELRKALQIPEGGPPPWLVNMQRYGPPPSYPNLKIPGLNAPIPEGASYGYHPGGWGKPPVDEFGRPLYGDVFGTAEADLDELEDVGVPKEKWGQMDDEVEEDEEDEEDEDGVALDDGASMTEDEINAGISSVTSTTPSGLATPDSVHLRKMIPDGQATPSGQSSTTGIDTPDSLPGVPSHAPPQLYQVLEQTSAKVGSANFGSSHNYIVPKAGAKRTGPGGVEVTLDPAELERLDEAALKAKYDELRKAEQEATAPEDVSDIIEEQERKRRKKLESQKSGDRKQSNFKF
ncbi:hypothetical protein AB1Y20_021973 [Prymnesium parvum]|uniref:PSP proline-rich domain-containing protein n=1 Tax=Prymnesium parvum TaxID=97485 RepID=A0AB34JI11_PRYPA